MKKNALYALMIAGPGFPFLYWANALMPGLPWSVYLYEAGRLCAILGFVLVFFQYVLSSRIHSIERGIGLDSLFRIHRKSGAAAFALILLHPPCLLLSERLQGYAAPIHPLKVLGALTFCVLSVAALAAILAPKFHWNYGTWKKIHSAAYAIFPMAFIHSFFIGTSVQKTSVKVFWLLLGAGYLAILFHKVIRRSKMRRHPFRVKGVWQETHDTWSLTFAGDRPSFMPGQFLILQLMKKGGLSASHPFTIASSPTQEALTISVKAVGDFTSSLATTSTLDRALIDMPYGTFSFLNHPENGLVFVAGGIGITPFMSMLRYLRDRKEERHVLLFWSNKHERDIAFRPEIAEMEQEMPFLKVVHIMSRQKDWKGERGHLDADKMKKYAVPLRDTHFFICGPPPMMTAAEETLRGLGVAKKRIHTERFSLR